MLSKEKILSSFKLLVRFEQPFTLSLFLLHALIFVILVSLNDPQTGDTPRYYELAGNIYYIHFFGATTPGGLEPEGIRLFGYPLFVIICSFLPGETDLNVVFAQGVLYLLSIFFVWKLIRKNLNSNAAIIFLCLLLFYPFIAYQSALLMPEAVCLFLLTLAVYIPAFSPPEKFVSGKFLLAGFLLALTVYFRSNLLPLPFFLTFIYLLVFKQHRKAVLLLPLAAILTLLPAVIYNYQTFKKPSPVPVFGGAQTSLWMATWHARVSTDSILKYRRGEITPAFAASGMTEQMAEINRRIGIEEKMFPINMANYFDNATRERVQNEYGRAALKNISETPFVYLKSCFQNIFRMWFSAHLESRNLSFAVEFCLRFSGIVVLLFGIAGLILLLTNPLYRFQPFVIISASILIFHSLTLCWLHTEARYTIPARLFLIAFAAYTISVIFRKMQNYFSAFENRRVDT